MTTEHPIDESPELSSHSGDRPAEARDFCRSLIRADETVRYGEVRRAARRLGLNISSNLFASVQRELAEGAMEEPAEREPSREATDQADRDLDLASEGSPEMDFLVAYLKSHPDATHVEVRTAARAEGHSIYPLLYALARKEAGRPARPRTIHRRPRKAATSTPSNAPMAFLVGYLTDHPNASYREVKSAAAGAGHQIFPISFGHARRLAGLERRSAPPDQSAHGRNQRRGWVSPSDAGPHGAAVAFVTEFLEAHPGVTYGEVKAAAAEHGHRVFPITYGFALSRVGRSPPKASAGIRKDEEPREPGGMPQSSDSVITDFVELIDRLRRQRTELRDAMAKIRDTARNCLARMK